MVLLMALPSAPAVAAVDNAYAVHPLVSNVAGAAPTTDPNLVNAWGLTASATSPWWVADNGTNVSTIYRADGSIVPLVVQVPVHPTGTVFWGSARARFVPIGRSDTDTRGRPRAQRQSDDLYEH